MSSSSYLIKNTVIVVGAKLFVQVLAFAMLPIYTHFLQPSEYGLMDLVLTYTALITPLLFANLHAALFRFLIDARDNKKKQSEIFTNAMSMSIWAVMAIFLALIVVFLFTNIDKNLVLSVAIYFLSFLVMDIFSQVARGLGKNKLFAMASIAQGLSSVLMSILFLVVFKMGVSGIFSALSLSLVLPALFIFYRLNLSKMYNSSLVSTKGKKELLGYSFPLVPNSVSWWVFNASDRTFLFAIVSAAANGIYAVSNKFSGVLFNLWSMFYLPLTESVALSIDKKNRDDFLSKVFSSILIVFSSIASLGIVLTSLLFPYLVSGPFREAYQYVPILMLAGLFNCIVGFYSSIYIAKKLTKEVMKVSFVAASINIVVMLALVWFMGIWAATISTLVAFVFTAFHRQIDIKRRGFELKVEDKNIIFSVAVVVIAFVLYYSVSSFWLRILGLIIVVVLAIYISKDILSYAKKVLLSKARHE